MTKYNMEILKIGRKWVHGKVSNKSNNNRYYMVTVAKEEILAIKNDITIGNVIELYADFDDQSNQFGKKYVLKNAISVSVYENEHKEKELAKIFQEIKDICKKDGYIPRKKIDFLESQTDIYNEELRKIEEEHEIAMLIYYIRESYDNGNGYIATAKIQRLQKITNEYNDEISEMKKTIENKKQPKEERQEKKKWFAKARHYQKGEEFFVGDDVYETLYSQYESSDGFSFGVMQETWYRVTAECITNTEKGQKLLADKKAKEIEENQKKEKNIAIKEVRNNLVNHIKEKGISNKKQINLSEIEKDGIIIYDDFDEYGSGTKIIVRATETWLIINNGIDGETWDINTITTGGAGAYGYIVENTDKTLYLIKEYMKITEQNINLEDLKMEENKLFTQKKSEEIPSYSAKNQNELIQVITSDTVDKKIESLFVTYHSNSGINLGDIVRKYTYKKYMMDGKPVEDSSSYEEMPVIGFSVDSDRELVLLKSYEKTEEGTFPKVLFIYVDSISFLSSEKDVPKLCSDYCYIKSATSSEIIKVEPVGKTLFEATEIIQNTISNIKSEFLQIGSILKQVRDEELYKQAEFKNVVEYAKTTFQMGRSQVYAYIKIYEMYGNDNRLKEYNFSQLRLLAENNTSVDDICLNYSPRLTKKELKEKLKEKIRPGGQSENKKSVQTEKVKSRNININDDETKTIIKALELLKSSDANIDINSLLRKLGG